MLSLLSHQRPSLFHKPNIEFFFLLSNARAWKNFVLRSPSLYQWTLLRWCHKISSLSSRSFIYLCNRFISEPSEPLWSCIVRELRIFLFSVIFFEMLPTTFLFQTSRSLAHLWMFDAIPFGVVERLPENQADSIISRQSSLLAHKASK